MIPEAEGNSEWVKHPLHAPHPPFRCSAGLSSRWLLSTYCMPGTTHGQQGGCCLGYFCAFRKQFLGFILAGSVFRMRYEILSRMPRHGCSQILSRGVFLTTTSARCHTHTRWNFPPDQQVLRAASLPLPTPSSCLAIAGLST